MLEDIIIWGFETLPRMEREVWIHRIIIDKQKVDRDALAELIDFSLGKLKHIMNTRKVTIFKPEGIEAYEALEKMVDRSGKDVIADMSAEEIADLAQDLQEKVEGENETPGMLN